MKRTLVKSRDGNHLQDFQWCTTISWAINSQQESLWHGGKIAEAHHHLYPHIKKKGSRRQKLDCQIAVRPPWRSRMKRKLGQSAPFSKQEANQTFLTIIQGEKIYVQLTGLLVGLVVLRLDFVSVIRCGQHVNCTIIKFLRLFSWLIHVFSFAVLATLEGPEVKQGSTWSSTTTKTTFQVEENISLQQLIANGFINNMVIMVEKTNQKRFSSRAKQRHLYWHVAKQQLSVSAFDQTSMLFQTLTGLVNGQSPLTFWSRLATRGFV